MHRPPPRSPLVHPSTWQRLPPPCLVHLPPPTSSLLHSSTRHRRIIAGRSAWGGLVSAAAMALAARLPWPSGPDAAFMAERAAAVMPAVSSVLCARGDRSDDREGRLDLRGFSEGGCEHLLHGDGVRVPSDCHRDDGVDFGLIRVNRRADLLLVVILRKSGAGRGRQRVSVGRVREGAGNPRRVSRIGADRLNGAFVQRARAAHLHVDVLRGDSDSGTLGIWFLIVRGSRARYASGARHGARNCSGGSRMRASDLTHYYVHRLASSKGGVRTQSPYLSEIFVF